MTGRDRLFIGGSWRPGSERIVVVDQATEEPIAEVGAGTPDDALAACEAAAAAQPAWARTPLRERAEVLRRVWALLVGATDELAELIVAEHGKPLADARGAPPVPRGARRSSGARRRVRRRGPSRPNQPRQGNRRLIPGGAQNATERAGNF